MNVPFFLEYVFYIQVANPATVGSVATAKIYIQIEVMDAFFKRYCVFVIIVGLGCRDGRVVDVCFAAFV